MDAKVTWIEDAAFRVESGSGHSLVVDGPEHIGGRNLGPRPMELMLMSVGACSSVDVVYILKRARQPVVGCQVEVKGTRADTEPAVFTDIHLNFIVSGEGLSEVQVKRAVGLSAEKYCSASIMLGRAGVKMTHSYAIRAS